MSSLLGRDRRWRAHKHCGDVMCTYEMQTSSSESLILFSLSPFMGLPKKRVRHSWDWRVMKVTDRRWRRGRIVRMWKRWVNEWSVYMHTSYPLYLFIFAILCVLEQNKRTHASTDERTDNTEIAWTFSGSINMRRVICCNHAQSIASGSGEPFHILWIHPSLYTQWRQFKCKSWHSHHSAPRRLLYQKLRRIGPDLNEPRSAQLYISSVCWSVCVSESVWQI